MEEKRILELLHLLAHPVRFRVAKALVEAGEPIFIEQIAKRTVINRRLVSFHLLTLSEHGLVNSDFRVSMLPKSKGKAARHYWLTDEGKEVLSLLIEIIK